VKRVDMCIIGSGSAGFSAAKTARDRGAGVVLVEKDPALAGQCILRGCMPAKAVFHAAEVAHEAKTAHEAGIDVPQVHVDARRILSRKSDLVEEFAEDRRKELEHFDVVRGEARFTSDRTIVVGDEEIEARRFIVATGSHLVVPALEGLDDCGYLIPEAALATPFSFRSLVVVGGGPVGCEFAQYFARLGVRVTLLQDASHLLRTEDEDVARAVCEGLVEDSIDIVTGARFRGATNCGNGKRIVVEVEGRERTFEAEEILCTVERRPMLDGLDLDAAGVRSNGGIVVDEFLESSNPRVYAAGDAIGRRMLVHAAVRHGEIAACNAIAPKSVAAEFDMLDAHSIYTDPEVAVVGLSERTARARGLNLRSASYKFADHGRAMTEDALIGFVKMLAFEDGTIAGITIVGKEASELAHEALTLLYFKAKVRDVLSIPHLHPTLAEIITYPAAELAI